jgi:hypothetical protein
MHKSTYIVSVYGTWVGGDCFRAYFDVGSVSYGIKLHDQRNFAPVAQNSVSGFLPS